MLGTNTVLHCYAAFGCSQQYVAQAETEHIHTSDDQFAVSGAALGAFLSWENEQASAKLLPNVLFQLGTVAFDRLHLITVR